MVLILLQQLRLPPWFHLSSPWLTGKKQQQQENYCTFKR
jgi:hypothetical protein